MLALSPLIRASLIALLILSLGIKIAARSREIYDDDGAPMVWQAERRDIITFFRHHGFQVDRTEDRPESSVIPASVGECRMLIVLASPQGWRRELVHRLASPGDQTFFVYRGTRYRDQPVWRTLIDHYWHRLYHYVGMALPPSPLFGVVASPVCELSRIPWQDIASLRPRSFGTR